MFHWFLLSLKVIALPPRSPYIPTDIANNMKYSNKTRKAAKIRKCIPAYLIRVNKKMENMAVYLFIVRF